MHVRNIRVCSISGPIPLEVILSILKVTGPRRIPAPNGAFLEMALQDIASRERVFAQMALVRALTGIYDASVTKQLTQGGKYPRLNRWRFRCFRCRYVLLQ